MTKLPKFNQSTYLTLAFIEILQKVVRSRNDPAWLLYNQWIVACTRLMDWDPRLEQLADEPENPAPVIQVNEDVYCFQRSRWPLKVKYCEAVQSNYY